MTLIDCKYIKVCPDAMLYVVLTSYVPTVYMSGQDIKAGQGGKNWDYSSYQHNVIIFFCNDKNGRVKCKARQQCSQWVKKKLVSDWPTDRPSNQLTERQPDKYSYIVCSLRDFKPVVGIHNQYASICHDSLQEKLF